MAATWPCIPAQLLLVGHRLQKSCSARRFAVGVLLPKERRGELRFGRAVSPPSACGLAEVTSVRRGLVPRTFVCAFPHSGGSKLVKSLPSGMVTDVRLPCL
jgi:hypothetical protein